MLITIQPCSSISPLRGFSAASHLQISLMAERHMPEIRIIALCEQAHSYNYPDSSRMAELLYIFCNKLRFLFEKSKIKKADLYYLLGISVILSTIQMIV